MASQPSPHVIFTCGREPAYPRNHFLETALGRFFQVESITSSTHWLPLRYAQVALRYPALLWKNHDLCAAGFLAQPLVPLLRIFTKKPILFDAFISIYDTLVFDRRKFAPESPVARLAFLLDQMSCALSRIILVDTQAHADYFQRTFGVPPGKMRVLPVGCDERIFSPIPEQRESPVVLYYSSFLPLHGTETVIRAAKLVQETDPGIRFHIIGRGMEYRRIFDLANRLAVKNVGFFPPVPLQQLPGHIAGAAVCLGGHFADSDKARRVIAGKTYQCLAMGKATIVGDNPANRELLTHGKDAWFCEMNNPRALADSILTLMGNPDLRAQIGGEARETFLRHASYAVLAEQLRTIVVEMIGVQSRGS